MEPRPTFQEFDSNTQRGNNRDTLLREPSEEMEYAPSPVMKKLKAQNCGFTVSLSMWSMLNNIPALTTQGSEFPGVHAINCGQRQTSGKENNFKAFSACPQSLTMAKLFQAKKAQQKQAWIRRTLQRQRTKVGSVHQGLLLI